MSLLHHLAVIALVLGGLPLWAPRGLAPEAGRVRRLLALLLGSAVVLRLALALLGLKLGGGAVTVTLIVGQAAAVLLLATLARLALTAPWRKGGVGFRFLCLGFGALLLWNGERSGATVMLSLALLRSPWLGALSTGERFRVVMVGLVAAIALFVGTPDLEHLSASLGHGLVLIRVARGVAIVCGVHAVLAGFKAFTTDPSLGIRRVSLRLTLSHVLVVTVPLLIVLTLWVSSAYLGVNADRALMAGRLVEREATVLETSTRATLVAARSPEAAARAMAAVRSARWPGTRVYLGREGAFTRTHGGAIDGERALAWWVSGLDSLRDHGVVDFGGERWLGAAVRDSGRSLVVLAPIADVLDSTLTPIMGADLVMVRPRPIEANLDSLEEFSSALRDSIDELDLPDGTADSIALARVRSAARSLGLPDSIVRTRARHRGVVLAAGKDTLSGPLAGFGLTGQVQVRGVRFTPDGWQDDGFALSVRASLSSILSGLFSKVRENPWQAVPVAALGALGLLLLPLFNTNLGMVRGMGRSITGAIRALREGAQAFGEGRLEHRIPIEGDDDLWDAAQRFNEMAAGLEQAREREQERARYENELEVARRIQARLLPSRPPVVVGYDVAGRSDSAREVGGDYYDHLDLGNGRWLLVVADVSGKGVPAALLMSGFRAALMSQDDAGPMPEPDRVASRLNEFLVASVEPGRFVTAFLGFLDAPTGRFVYVNAGHNPPLLRRASGEVEMLREGGLILGILPGSTFESGATTLAAGDVLVLYTDGVTEGADATGEQWGDERLIACLSASHAGSATAIGSRIADEVRAFEGDTGPADDLTVLVVKRLPQA